MGPQTPRRQIHPGDGSHGDRSSLPARHLVEVSAEAEAIDISMDWFKGKIEPEKPIFRGKIDGFL